MPDCRETNDEIKKHKPDCGNHVDQVKSRAEGGVSLYSWDYRGSFQNVGQKKERVDEEQLLAALLEIPPGEGDGEKNDSENKTQISCE